LDNKKTVEKLKDDFKTALKELSTEDIKNIAKYIYTRVGEKQIETLIDINPTKTKNISSVITKLNSDDVKPEGCSYRSRQNHNQYLIENAWNTSCRCK
jgi:hypothetical protein